MSSKRLLAEGSARYLTPSGNSPIRITVDKDVLTTKWKRDAPKISIYGNESGSWTMQLFNSAMAEFRVAWHEEHPLGLRSIIFLDGCGIHHDREAMLKNFEHGHNFVFLPKNTTHFLQPLDVGYFRDFKKRAKDLLYVKSVQEWADKNKRIDHLLLSCVIDILGQKEDPKDRKRFAMRFAETGLYPFNAKKIMDLAEKAVLGSTPETKPLGNPGVDKTTISPMVYYRKEAMDAASKLIESRCEQKTRSTNVVQLEFDDPMRIASGGQLAAKVKENPNFIKKRKRENDTAEEQVAKKKLTIIRAEMKQHKALYYKCQKCAKSTSIRRAFAKEM